MTPAEFEEVLAQPLAANVGRVETGGRVTFMAVPPGRYTLVCAAGQINAKGGPLHRMRAPHGVDCGRERDRAKLSARTRARHRLRGPHRRESARAILSGACQ